MVVTNERRGTVLAEHVTLAGSSETRRQGLLGNTEMPPGYGLWIVPCEAVHTFFMKFPIDIVFLDRERHVVRLIPALKPWRIGVCLRAHSVLELEAGTITRTGTSLSDVLRFQQL